MRLSPFVISRLTYCVKPQNSIYFQTLHGQCQNIKKHRIFTKFYIMLVEGFEPTTDDYKSPVLPIKLNQRWLG